MKKIPLGGKHGKGRFAIVDDSDYEFLMQFKWYAMARANSFYARTEAHKNADGHIRPYMHRMMLGVTDPKIFVDHKDHDGLNNQRANLRVCTRLENQRNRSSAKNSSSKYLGVCKLIRKGKYRTLDGALRVYTYAPVWVAYIKGKHLGYFKTEVEAAKAYNEAAQKYYGEFANLNNLNP